MPPQVALALTLILIAYLLRRESREEPRLSAAVWLPTLWLMINGSRQVSQWLGSGPSLSAEALSEGNAIDQVVYAALIVAGLCILARRRVALGEIARNNLPIVLFLAYCALSILWSDHPLTASKRWIKALGDPVMVLVLWSDRFPVRAIVAAIRRTAFVLIPLSVLFCKYYENLGRVFDGWGKSSYTGVTNDKNMFGYLLFVFGLYFAAALISRWSSRAPARKGDRTDQAISVLILAMVGWLVPIANSKTATLALIAGLVIVASLQFAAIRRHFMVYALVAIAVVSVGDSLFSVRSAIFEASGRDATFTGRTGLWQTVLQEPINPVIGEGYASFWLGERLLRFWAMYPTSPPIQAHNGYIEVYLNLGIVGVCLIAGLLWWGLQTVRRRAVASLAPAMAAAHREQAFATFGVAYAVAYLLYNITEATFQGLNFLFMIFLILAFRARGQARSAKPAPVAAKAVERRNLTAAGRARSLR